LKRMQVTDRLGIPSHWCQTCQESLAKRLWRGTRFWWVVVEVCTLISKEERAGSNISVDRLEGRELDLTRDDGKRRRSCSLATLEMNKEKKLRHRRQVVQSKKNSYRDTKRVPCKRQSENIATHNIHLSFFLP
jgi:hypothetical protein